MSFYQETYFERKIMENNQIIQTNSTFSFILHNRLKTWVGDNNGIFKPAYFKYNVNFQDDGSISLNFMINDTTYIIAGINSNYQPSPDYQFYSTEEYTDNSPFFYFKEKNKLGFVSNPDIQSVSGSWEILINNVDPNISDDDAGLWVSNEKVNLFDMQFLFNKNIVYKDYIATDFTNKGNLVPLKIFIPSFVIKFYNAKNARALLENTPDSSELSSFINTLYNTDFTNVQQINNVNTSS